MNEAIFTQLQKEMDGSVSALRKELAKMRTGRASTSLLEHVDAWIITARQHRSTNWLL